MTPTPTNDTTGKRLEEMTAMEWAVLDAERTATATAEMLTAACNQVIERMARTIDTVARRENVNSLGELQGRALDVDRLCALYYEQHMELTRLCRLNERVEAETHAAFVSGSLSVRECPDPEAHREQPRTIKARLGEPRPAWEAGR
jgi:hypothetical protein